MSQFDEEELRQSIQDQQIDDIPQVVVSQLQTQDDFQMQVNFDEQTILQLQEVIVQLQTKCSLQEKRIEQLHSQIGEINLKNNELEELNMTLINKLQSKEQEINDITEEHQKLLDAQVKVKRVKTPYQNPLDTYYDESDNSWLGRMERDLSKDGYFIRNSSQHIAANPLYSYEQSSPERYKLSPLKPTQIKAFSDKFRIKLEENVQKSSVSVKPEQRISDPNRSVDPPSKVNLKISSKQQLKAPNQSREQKLINNYGLFMYSQIEQVKESQSKRIKIKPANYYKK